MDLTNKDKWASLLDAVLTEPGVAEKAFQQFHRFSIGNQMLAFFQCRAMGIEYGPMATFDAWKRKGRYVAKGSKALHLWQPMTVPASAKNEEGEYELTGGTRVLFKLAAKWFVYAQTNGGKDEVIEPEVEPSIWLLSTALDKLDIKLVPFGTVPVSGSCLGYAFKRNIAISPMVKRPLATQLHELGHVVLGHTTKDDLMSDTADLSKSIKELEAESVAMLCMDALGHSEHAQYARHYIQGWMKETGVKQVPEDSARRIFAAADKILKAGATDMEAVFETVREDEQIAQAA